MGQRRVCLRVHADIYIYDNNKGFICCKGFVNDILCLLDWFISRHTLIMTSCFFMCDTLHKELKFSNFFIFCVTLYTRNSNLSIFLFFCVIFRSPQESNYLHVNRTTHNLCEYSPSLQLPCHTIEYCYRTAYHNNIIEVQFNSTHSEGSDYYYIIWYILHTQNNIIIIYIYECI